MRLFYYAAAAMLSCTVVSAAEVAGTPRDSNIQTANVMERNNLGNELIETGVTEGNALLDLNKEMILAQWDKEQNVKQTIGIPWLSKIPYIGYLFGSTTTSREKIHVCLTVQAEMLDTAKPDGPAYGELTKVGK